MVLVKAKSMINRVFYSMEYVSWAQNVGLLAVVSFIIAGNMFFYYSVNEGVFALFIACAVAGVLLVDLYYLVSKESVFYSFMLKVVVTIFYTVFAFLNPWYFAFIAINILGAISQVFKTSRAHPFFTRFRFRGGKIAPLILVAIATSPFVYMYSIQASPVYVTIPSGNQTSKFEVNWTWGRNETLSTPLLDTIQGLNNNLTHVYISVLFPIPEEYMTNTSLAITAINQCYARNITVDLNPMLRNDTYVSKGYYLRDSDIDLFIQSYQLFKEWIVWNNLTYKFRYLVLDIESWQIGTALHDWWDAAMHDNGVAKMRWLINDMHNNPVRNFTIAGTTFGSHLSEMFDYDDSQQQLFKMAPWPTGVRVDYFGFMTFETGPGSAQAIYGYCNAINKYFGTDGTPYIISADTDENILLKFKIIRNYGFPGTGIWALSDFLDPKTHNGTIARFQDMMAKLDQDQDVGFYFDNLQYVGLNWLITWVDFNLWNQPIFANWTRWGDPIRN